MGHQDTQKLGRYELLALLATGGMAEIHLARQTGIQGFERIVVVKKILPHLAREKAFLDMFLDEARLAAQLAHPNIVQVYDLGQEGDEYYIAMEYLEGESLGYTVREAIRVGHQLPSDLAAGVVAQVCDALAYAHKLRGERGQSLQIVHRDICPHNIIVLFSGVVKVVDFGIAKAASQAHKTRVGTLKGKLAYMPPEQCMSKPVDGRSDLFALGVVFWELLTHRRLFKRDTEVAMLQAIVSEEIPDVREFRPEVPEELAAIVRRAVQKDPGDRFQSAEDMGRAVRDFLRWIGAPAGTHEIATFLDRVFAERARIKGRLLEEIRASRSSKVSLGLLKPDTDGSMPSHSELKGVVTESRSAEPPTLFLSGEQPTNIRPAGGKRRPAVWWAVALPLLLLVGWLGWWLLQEPAGRTGGALGAPAGPAAGGPGAAPDGGAEPAVDGAAEAELAALAGGEPAAVERGPADVMSLQIESSPPGCKAFVDEVEVPGETPLSGVVVEARVEHVVAVVCRDHQRDSQRVSGDPGSSLALRFSPRPSRPSPPPAPEVGTLRLNTKPWSVVYLDRRKLGITPLMGARLPVGTHRLTLVNSEQGLRKTLTVTIQAGKTTTQWVDLRE